MNIKIELLEIIFYIIVTWAVLTIADLMLFIIRRKQQRRIKEQKEQNRKKFNKLIADQIKNYGSN